MKCPWYQGVCTLNEDFICYSSADSCDIYRDWLNNTDKDTVKKICDRDMPISERIKLLRREK